MSEKQYSSEYYIKGNNYNIRTIEDLKEFISFNTHLKEEVLIKAIKPYLSIATNQDYINTMIKRILRKNKIQKLLKDNE